MELGAEAGSVGLGGVGGGGEGGSGWGGVGWGGHLDAGAEVADLVGAACRDEHGLALVLLKVPRLDGPLLQRRAVRVIQVKNLHNRHREIPHRPLIVQLCHNMPAAGTATSAQLLN